MDAILWSEILWAGISLLLLVSYHGYWIYQLRWDPLKTYQGVKKFFPNFWVASIMKEKRDILAVQTLRNWTMAANFLATTAIFIGLGVFTFWFKAEHFAEMPFDLTLIFTRIKTFFLVKLMVLVSDFYFAFYSFTLSIRYLNHVNFMINVPLDESDPVVSVEYTAHTLDLAMMHYTLGMRAYYLAVIFALWLFGPQWMLLGTVVVLSFIYRMDHCSPIGKHSHFDLIKDSHRLKK